MDTAVVAEGLINIFIHGYIHFFCIYKNLFYKNIEAEIYQNFKDMLLKNIPQAVSRRTSLFCPFVLIS